jgi:hypothetical protein
MLQTCLQKMMVGLKYISHNFSKSQGEKVMVTRVKIPSAVPSDPPKPVNAAVIDGQGTIPYKGGRETFAEAPMDVPDGIARGRAF